jgi:hypothetical protein
MTGERRQRAERWTFVDARWTLKNRRAAMETTEPAG